jgi:hypothetical protein
MSYVDTFDTENEPAGTKTAQTQRQSETLRQKAQKEHDLPVDVFANLFQCCGDGPKRAVEEYQT